MNRRAFFTTVLAAFNLGCAAKWVEFQHIQPWKRPPVPKWMLNSYRFNPNFRNPKHTDQPDYIVCNRQVYEHLWKEAGANFREPLQKL